MRQPYPSAGRSQEPAARPQPPRSVVMAVRFMYAGAVLSVVGVIIVLATVGQLRGSLHQAYPKLSPAKLHQAEVSDVTYVVVRGLIGAALWVWMAILNKAGKGWARIVGTVLFAVQTLLLVLTLGLLGAGGGNIFSILPWLIGLGAVVYLWRRESTEYFNASRGW
jgi:hypothetical protein